MCTARPRSTLFPSTPPFRSGASPRMRFDIVLNNLTGIAWTRREIRMTSDGTPWRPLVHVADICDAIAEALEAPCEAVHRSEEHTSELQSLRHLVCRLLLDKT